MDVPFIVLFANNLKWQLEAPLNFGKHWSKFCLFYSVITDVESSYSSLF